MLEQKGQRAGTTGLLEIHRGKLVFTTVLNQITNSPLSLAEGLEILYDNTGYVYFFVPGSQMRTYTSETSLVIPDRSMIGKGFPLTIRGRRLSSVMSKDRAYILSNALAFLPL